MSRVRNTAPAIELLERPLNARSVIGSLLLGVHPPRLPGARIVQWCTRFGIAEGTARVALSRMVDRGELANDDGIYELAGRVRALQPAQDWSLAPTLNEWDGTWRLFIVDGVARDAPARAALRQAMRRIRHGEVREAVWTRPDNLPRDSAPAESWTVVETQCSRWTAAPAEDPAQLADALFAPDAWASRTRGLVEQLVAVTDAISADDDDALATGFVAGAAALQQARRDPLLPAALLPRDWPGDELRASYVRFQRAFAASMSNTLRS